MKLFSMLTRLLAALLLLSGAALADANRTDQERRQNPFADEFLPICGSIVFSGADSFLGVSNFRNWIEERSQLKIRSKGDRIFCGLYDSHNIRALEFEGDRQLLAQPWWLGKPDIVGTIFDQWIEKNRSVVNILPKGQCRDSIGRRGPITEVLYSKAVSIEDTGQVISVEIYRTAESYIDPNRGHSIGLSAWASNHPAECARMDN